MNIEGFVAAQQGIIAECGIDDFLPVVWVDGRFLLKVNILFDPPDETIELEAAARDWALHRARKRDYLLAFRSSALHFKVISRIGGVTTERIVPISAS